MKFCIILKGLKMMVKHKTKAVYSVLFQLLEYKGEQQVLELYLDNHVFYERLK